MFVGRDYGKDKVLLGVGKLTGTDTGGTTITTDTTSVTFTISAIQSGLLVDEETSAPGVAVDSFSYYYNTGFTTDTGNAIDGDNATNITNNGGYLTRNKHSLRVSLGGINYPMYSLPIGLVLTGTPAQGGDPSRTLTYARYKFSSALQRKTSRTSNGHGLRDGKYEFKGQ